MTKISISIETGGLNATQANNLAAFLTSIAENYVAGSPQPSELVVETEQEEKPKATRNRAKKVEAPIEEAKAEEVEVVEPETVAPPKVDLTDAKHIPDPEQEDDLMGEEVPAITIEQIRSLVSEKQADHKEDIRGKLKEFDAANVTALPKENYGAFYTFLKGL
jgi:hypothetical protein